MPLKDREARRAYHREYMRRRYHEDAEFRKKQLKAVRKNTIAHRQRARHAIREWKKRGCLMCDEAELCCYVAHHRDPSTKEVSVANAVRQWVQPARLQAELAKCECLCANCHAKVHAGLLDLLDYI